MRRLPVIKSGISMIPKLPKMPKIDLVYLPLIRIRPVNTFSDRAKWKYQFLKKALKWLIQPSEYSRSKRFIPPLHRMEKLTKRFQFQQKSVDKTLLSPIYLLRDQGIFKTFAKKRQVGVS
jgi:hypothetical protein